MPWPSTHGPPSLPSATPTPPTVLWSAVRALLVSRCCRSTIFRAGAFHFFSVIAVFFITGFGIFFALAKRVFYLCQFVRIEPLGFVFPGGLLVHMRVTHGFHQFLAHGNHLFAGLAQNFFFQFLE